MLALFIGTSLTLGENSPTLMKRKKKREKSRSPIGLVFV